MRFKKLRIFVGIALVIFIFIVGNVILFGELSKTNSEPKIVAAIKNNSMILVSIPIINETKKSNIAVPIIKDVPIVKHNPVVVHNKVRTRAS